MYCFSNEHWSSTTKEVSFNVHGIVYVPESEAPSDPLEIEGTLPPFPHTSRVRTQRGCCAGLYARSEGSEERIIVQALMFWSTTVKQLSEMLNQIKDEQSYIVMRERTHRNTAESTNARVKWWSVFQLGVLIGEGIFQVWWLKRFFEVRIHSHPSPVREAAC